MGSKSGLNAMRRSMGTLTSIAQSILEIGIPQWEPEASVKKVEYLHRLPVHLQKNHDSTTGWEDDHVAILDLESAAGADKLGNAAGIDPTEVESSLNDQELQDPFDTVIESEAHTL